LAPSRTPRSTPRAPTGAPARGRHAKKAVAKGGGKATSLAAKLAQLGIRNDLDLILHLPLRYEDETCITAIGHAPPGRPVQIEGRVSRVEVAYRPRRQLIVRIADETGEAALRFFHFYGSQQKAL
jgi:ATP-dependent DNA helicase RecG